MTTKSTLKKIDISRIAIDPDVQRVEGVSEHRVQQIANNFDILAFGTITVSERTDGTLVCLDGMHRVAAARRSGYTGLAPAVVISGLNKAAEARLFNLLNATKTPSMVTKFVIGVLAGDPQRVAINKIVEAAGWKVGGHTDDGVIRGVTALERIYSNGSGTLPTAEHPEHLERTLDIITRAWEWSAKSGDALLLEGVSMLLGRFGDTVDDRKLVEQMADTQPGNLIGKGRAMRDLHGGTVPAGIARVLVGLHNKKRRTNLLPEWVWTR